MNNNNDRHMIPCFLDKKRFKGNKFYAGVSAYYARSLNTPIAACVTQRYWKGIDADGDNMVIVYE